MYMCFQVTVYPSDMLNFAYYMHSYPIDNTEKCYFSINETEDFYLCMVLYSDTKVSSKCWEHMKDYSDMVKRQTYFKQNVSDPSQLWIV